MVALAGRPLLRVPWARRSSCRLSAGKQVCSACTALSNRESPITCSARTRDALLLHLPPQECPTVAINGHRRNRCPDLPTMHINHIQRRFPWLTTVLFVHSQRSGRRGLLLVQPCLRCKPCLFHDASYTSQAQIDPVHVVHAGLNFSIAGMRFNQQRQNQSRKWSWLLRQQRASQRCFQGLGTRGCPTIQRLTRDTLHMTQLCDHSMFGFRQHLTDPVNALLNRATMVPVSCLRTVMFLTCSPSLSGILARQLCASIVTVVQAHFEPCLTYN